MSGFQYQCDVCRRVTGDVDGRGNGSLCGVDGCAGRLRLSREWLGRGKNFGSPGGSGEEGGGGPLDPTGPFSRAEKDETLPADICGDGGIIAYADEELELPIDAYVTVSRKSGVSRKMIRAWGAMGHRVVTVQCSECRKTCVCARSTLKVIEGAREKGLRYEPICGECQEELGVDEAAGGIVAEQAKELREVQRLQLMKGAKEARN